ncbi:MAG: ATP-dependent Clp protease proteolytic subunit [Planctomycetota bacterium]|nr:ATP-dependent Clp protease proteolytic subunit [Planctomycetota bacterium]
MRDKQLAAIIKSRTLVLSEPVSSEMVEKSVQLLTFMEAEDATKPVTVLLNSPGGEAYSGLGLYDTLRYMRPPIHVVVNGLCASAAILTVLAADKENRYSLPNSRFMIHQPRGGARGTSSDIQIEAIEIKKLRSMYYEIISKQTGRELAQVEKDSDRDCWLSAEEAVEYGLVSKVITHRGEIE